MSKGNLLDTNIANAILINEGMLVVLPPEVLKRIKGSIGSRRKK